ncbi:TetR/AcrR family transcriptional regulator [Actinomadura violacea]|uniref:TetR/AcrR family transcriptional regulator n=1 Tax=Actinomadura violacea TaxID=2819934 RepID=A0ABS3RQ27_9ACTN|nr:TetR/AcrR family transcriptional regulator [Actinomadura violacea]MBO2458169.1 TetR/AcrR family transcriptional regulator [Actinomadura violacea]
MGRPKQFEPDVAVDQAMRVFWRQGYAATTPQELAQELGIGKGSLYNAFTSKHRLFEMALRRYGEMRVAALEEILERPGPVKPLLRAALERVAAVPDDVLRHGCLAVNTAAELAGKDEIATEVVSAVFSRMERALRSAVERARGKGEIDASCDPGGVAGMLLSVVVGMNVLAKTGGDPRQRLRTVDAVLAAL